MMSQFVFTCVSEQHVHVCKTQLEHINLNNVEMFFSICKYIAISTYSMYALYAQITSVYLR